MKSFISRRVGGSVVTSAVVWWVGLGALAQVRPTPGPDPNGGGVPPVRQTVVNIIALKAQAAEQGDGRSRTLVFEVTTQPPLGEDMSVFYRVEGSASNGVDYELLPGRAVIPAGASSASITTQVLPDALTEGVESVAVILEPPICIDIFPPPPTCYLIGPQGAAKAAIADSQGGQPPDTTLPLVSIRATVPETTEPRPNTRVRPAVVTVSRQVDPNVPPSGTLVVFLKFSGAATRGGDYSAPEETVVLNPGAVEVALQVPALQDEEIEGDETVVVELAPPPATVAPYRIDPAAAAAKLIIHDATPTSDVPLVSIIASAPVTTETPDSNGQLPRPGRFTVSRTGPLDQSLMVWLKYSGTALPGTDYRTLPDTVTIAANRLSAELEVVAAPDGVAEGDETVVAELQPSPTMGPRELYRIDPTQAAAKVLIQDQPSRQAVIVITDPPDGTAFREPAAIDFQAEAVDPNGAICELEWFAGDQSIGKTQIVFIRQPDPGTPIYHQFAWQKPPAGAHAVTARGLDAAGKLVISRAVTVRVGGDLPPAGQVVLEVVAAEPFAGEPGPDGQLKPGLFKIIRAGGPKDIEVPLFFELRGSAQPGVDYKPVPDRLVLPAGADSLGVPIVPIADATREGPETVVFALLPPNCIAIFPPPPACYLLGPRSTAEVIINDAGGLPPGPVMVAVLTPQNGSVLALGADVPIEAAVVLGAADALELDLLIDEVLVFQLKQQAKLQYTWATAGLDPAKAAGPHTIAVRALSAAGEIIARAAISVWLRPAPPSAFVVRKLPGAVVGGQPFTVTLAAAPPAGASAYALEDTPPQGWAVSGVSDDGLFDAITGKVKFGPFSDAQARTVSYLTTPPADFVGRAAFAGVASADGQSSPIGGDSVVHAVFEWHPADVRPADGRISLDELTAYVAAWKQGAAWPTGPTPIPASFVTSAGQLWRQGESYTFDPAKGAPPLCWTSPGPGPTPGARVERTVPPVNAPGQPLTVRLQLQAQAGAQAAAVEELVPSGWSVGAISDGGVFDPVSGLIRWGLFLGQIPAELTYTVTPPAGIASVANFTGTASIDGQTLAAGGSREAVAADAKTALRFASLARSAGGPAVLRLTGAQGQLCAIETSTDLTHWAELQTVVLTQSPFEFRDERAAASSAPHRFYRVRAVNAP